MSMDYQNGDRPLIDREDENFEKLQEVFIKLADDLRAGKLTDEEKENLVKNLNPKQLEHLQEMLRKHIEEREKDKKDE